jgi:hypothetical protein
MQNITKQALAAHHSGSLPIMAVLVLSLGITYAAVCVWLAVRIVKRRERWAKLSLAAVVSLPVLYVLSIGPVAWLNTRHRMPESVSRAIKHAHDPIDWLMAHSPKPFDNAIRWYAQLWYASPPPPDTTSPPA